MIIRKCDCCMEEITKYTIINSQLEYDLNGGKRLEVCDECYKNINSLFLSIFKDIGVIDPCMPRCLYPNTKCRKCRYSFKNKEERVRLYRIDNKEEIK